MWRETLKRRIEGFLSRPQTRRHRHMAAFEVLEAGEVSTGVVDRWDGTSPLCLCEACYTLNRTEYLLCRRCAGRLRYQPRLQPSQIRSHLDATDK
ncbi:MAG: hypothetical protein PPP58_03165 [Natronomonas sp.]